jgi:hypothetical protein
MSTNRSKDRSCLCTFTFADGHQRRKISAASAADGARSRLHTDSSHRVSEPFLP